MDSNPTICEEKLTTSNPNRKGEGVYRETKSVDTIVFRFLLYNFSKFLYIFVLFIHPSILNITNIALMMVQENRNAIVSTDFVSL